MDLLVQNTDRDEMGRLADDLLLYGMEELPLDHLTVVEGDLSKLRDPDGKYIAAVLEKAPFLVAYTAEGRLAGYACAHPWHTRRAFAWDVHRPAGHRADACCLCEDPSGGKPYRRI